MARAEGGRYGGRGGPTGDRGGAKGAEGGREAERRRGADGRAEGEPRWGPRRVRGIDTLIKFDISLRSTNQDDIKWYSLSYFDIKCLLLG